MTEAFPWETAPRYLLRDRDTSYGPAFRARVKAMSIEELQTASRSTCRIHLSNASSARSAANAWITSSSSTSVTGGASCRAIFNIITGPEPISRSTRIVHSPAPSSLPLQARLSPSQRSAVYITAMNVARHDRRARFGVKDRRIFTVVLTCNGAQNFHSFCTRRRRPRCTDRTRNTYSTIGRRRFQRQIHF